MAAAWREPPNETAGGGLEPRVLGTHRLDDPFEQEPRNAERIDLGPVRLVNHPAPGRSLGQPARVAGEARGLDVKCAAILRDRIGKEADHRGALDDDAEGQ